MKYITTLLYAIWKVTYAIWEVIYKLYDLYNTKVIFWEWRNENKNSNKKSNEANLKELFHVRGQYLYSRAKPCGISNSNSIQTHNHLVRKQTLNGWVLVYKLSGCGFESHCCHLNFRYCTCFKQGVPWHPSWENTSFYDDALESFSYWSTRQTFLLCCLCGEIDDDLH